MTTSIWFHHEGKRYFAKIACQNGTAKVLEAKTEEGKEVDTQYIEPHAVKAHKRIHNWGYIPEPEPELEPEDD
jgi:hypothetical protein